jgi:hypothetical protein
VSFRPTLLACMLSLASGLSQATCYLVYRENELVYQSSEAPVDLSVPLSESVPAKFGVGAVLVDAPDSQGCFERQVAVSSHPVSSAVPRPTGRPVTEGVRRRLPPKNRPDASNNEPSPRLNLDNFFVGSELTPTEGLGYGYQSPDGGPVFTGPRGGRFRITSSGGKAYLGRGGGRGRGR